MSRRCGHSESELWSAGDCAAENLSVDAETVAQRAVNKVGLVGT
jgi:hypothetical protein